MLSFGRNDSNIIYNYLYISNLYIVSEIERTSEINCHNCNCHTSSLFTFHFSLTMFAPVMADSDRVITFEQLPAQVQTMLKKNFAHKVPLVVTADWDDYTVRFQSGEKAEFDKRGNWREFDCRMSAVPTALIPEQIKAGVEKTFPGAVIVKIDRDRRGTYDVKLNNGMELEFNSYFQVIDIDD